MEESWELDYRERESQRQENSKGQVEKKMAIDALSHSIQCWEMGHQGKHFSNQNKNFHPIFCQENLLMCLLTFKLLFFNTAGIARCLAARLKGQRWKRATGDQRECKEKCHKEKHRTVLLHSPSFPRSAQWQVLFCKFTDQISG